MVRKTVLSLSLALIALLALAVPVLAGGVVVSLDGMPSDPQAGEPFNVGFTIYSAHTGEPESNQEPTITAINPETQEKVVVTALREGAEGHYTASLTLPSAGEWQWEIQPLGKYAENYPASEMTPLQVRPAQAQPAAAGGPGSSLPLPSLALAGAVLVLAVLGVLALAFGRRRAAVRP